MNNHIILSKEQAESIRGRYGRCSEIRPIELPDGNYIIPEQCVNEADLKDVKESIQSFISADNVQSIEVLPKMGSEVKKGKIYSYENILVEGSLSLVIAQQDHIRTEHDPKDIPALFTFFRDNADDLLWIPNEKVDLGWKRIYDGKPYEVIQAHMTLSTWTPDVAPALWKNITITEEYKTWSATDHWTTYTIGDKRIDAGKLWECINVGFSYYQPSSVNGHYGWKYLKDV